MSCRVCIGGMLLFRQLTFTMSGRFSITQFLFPYSKRRNLQFLLPLLTTSVRDN